LSNEKLGRTDRLFFVSGCESFVSSLLGIVEETIERKMSRFENGCVFEKSLF